MPLPPLEREPETLRYVAGHVRDHGIPPTLRQIADHLGLASSSGAKFVVDALVEKGLLNVPEGRRAIQITDKGRQAAGIPVVGTVPAGTPILAIENRLGALLFEQEMGDLSKLFALRVKGHSMRDAGINDGDFVIVREQPVVDNGDIGVAFIGDEATVKKFRKLKTGWKLEPANQAFEPLQIAWDDPNFRVGGKVIAVFRRM